MGLWGSDAESRTASVRAMRKHSSLSAGRRGLALVCCAVLCCLDLPNDELHAPEERDGDLALLLNHASALPLHRIAGLPRGQRVGGWASGATGVAEAGDC